MKRNLLALAAIGAIMAPAALAEGNMPLVQTKYTADPAPIVRNDTIYLYTSHDEDNAEGFLMKNWLLYTSTDMVNWQDRGVAASLEDFKWLTAKTEHGPFRWWSATASGICIVLSTDMESACLWPIHLTAPSRIPSASR